jgi:hypothetical protein
MRQPKFRRPEQAPCTADHKVGPTVEMKGVREPGHRCPDCHDSGWTIVSHSTTAAATAMPCRVCNPVQYQRWTNGCLSGKQAHCGCEVCVAGRNGTVGLSDYAPDGTLLTGAL